MTKSEPLISAHPDPITQKQKQKQKPKTPIAAMTLVHIGS
jgi:hypothetical protein